LRMKRNAPPMPKPHSPPCRKRMPQHECNAAAHHYGCQARH
jgi:hypothetical protein